MNNCTKERVVCHCEKKENAEIIAKILDCDIDGKIADVVEVVRCKDCKHLVEIDPNNLYVCARIDFGMDGEPNFLSPKIDFCSRGERKETE